MLNTKPIKKKNYELYDNEKNLLGAGSDKIVIIENSKQKELENMVKQANSYNKNNSLENNSLENNSLENNSLENNILKINNPLENNILKINNPLENNNAINEFTHERYKDNNLNVSGLIDGNKQFIEKSNNKDNSILEYNFNHNNIINKISNNITNKIEWNENNNLYTIYDSGNKIECNINNENILKSILNNEYNDYGIKKYFFISKWNQSNENYEFNFIESILTHNFEIMVRIQNFIYDTLINFENLNISDTYNYQDVIILFYFQMIIYFFNNINIYSSTTEMNKISKIYSSLVYRFSTLILKNTIKIKNNIDKNTNILDNLINIRGDILSQINQIENNINNLIITDNNHNNSSSKTDTISNKSIKSNSTESTESTESTKKSSPNYKIINSRNLNLSTEDSDTSMNITQETNKKLKNLKDIFSEDIRVNSNSESSENNSYNKKSFNNNTSDSEHNENYDSDKNGYIEINDTLSGYSKFLNKNYNIKKITPIENEFSITNNTELLSSSDKNISYNLNSANKNAKIYKIII